MDKKNPLGIESARYAVSLKLHATSVAYHSAHEHSNHDNVMVFTCCYSFATVAGSIDS